jgi:hypothetical protein
VPGGITLKRLHDSLQAVMGWTDSHLHQFEAGGVLYGISDRETGLTRVSENKTTLDQLPRRPKDRLRYEYDFGDGWEHDVILEAVLPPGNDPEHRDMLEWIGKPQDPESFDVGQANLDIHGRLGSARFGRITCG